MAHATCPAKDRFDGRVQRLDDAEPHGMIAVGGDAVEVIHQRVAELLHLRQPLPTQGLQPAPEKACHPVAGLVGQIGA